MHLQGVMYRDALLPTSTRRRCQSGWSPGSRDSHHECSAQKAMLIFQYMGESKARRAMPRASKIAAVIYRKWCCIIMHCESAHGNRR